MRASFYRGAYGNSGVVSSHITRSLATSAHHAQQHAPSHVPRGEARVPSARGLAEEDMALRAEYRKWREGSTAASSTADSLASAMLRPEPLPALRSTRGGRSFIPGRELGRGAFGVVVAARLRNDPAATEYAIKIVPWPADVDAAALGEVRGPPSSATQPDTRIGLANSRL